MRGLGQDLQDWKFNFLPLAPHPNRPVNPV
jgi:hypothetical protein